MLHVKCMPALNASDDANSIFLHKVRRVETGDQGPL